MRLDAATEPSAQAGVGNSRATARDDLAGLDPVVDRGRSGNHEVERLSCVDLLLHHRGLRGPENDPVTRLALHLRSELSEHPR
jgi:hypothetical protein